MTTADMVFCRKFNEKKPGLVKAPIPGPIGELILNNISQEAWDEWQDLQMKIINEERLDLSEKASQEKLYSYMIDFLNLENI